MRPDRRSLKTVFLHAAAAALVGMPLIAAGTAHAQDTDPRAMANRIDRIEREISDLQRQAYSGGGSSGSPVVMESGAGAANLQARVVELEDQVRALNGRLEEANHRAETLARNLEAFRQDVDLRFRDLGAASAPAGASAGGEGGAQSSAAPAQGTLGAASPAGSPGAAAGGGSAPSVLPNGTPETQYDFAIDLMKRGQYDKARGAFEEFLQLHPKHALAGNAQYWLGETFYAQNDYKRAGDAFLTGYTTYASSSKAPDSLLKLGMSLAALDNKDAACTVWGELGSKFPQASPSVVARAKLERQKAGC
ncbi:tol-pal system protein YbgF [Parvibaculum sp.]|uniref:tol-pal system protein YbgF n=2 Tax=Parvibaculum sp. TaxID=2024848 RepID=UPI003297CB81